MNCSQFGDVYRCLQVFIYLRKIEILVGYLEIIINTNNDACMLLEMTEANESILIAESGTLNILPRSTLSLLAFFS